MLINDVDLNLHHHFVHQMTALHLAASSRDLSVVQLLVDRKSDVNAKDRVGSNPLHHATSNDDLSVVQLLIDRGANVYAKNDHGKTCLTMAKYDESWKVYRYFKKNLHNICQSSHK
eukprot:TRINITY_DN195_c0_g4_i1.p1 TRINITY_DN195_c0_g4~~TRINITY_DN195_c0_g4_i1.p1  ORF type:complete len:116 (-),score=20.63 TRINITY_DN195_c0_g4_i1:45-392(-)